MIDYKIKYQKYKEQHNEKIKCKECGMCFPRANKSYHLTKNKYHKLIVCFKKKIYAYNNGEQNKEINEQIVK